MLVGGGVGAVLAGVGGDGVASLAGVVGGGKVFPGTRSPGPLPPLSERQRALGTELRATVETLAGTIGERSTARPEGMRAAAKSIADQLREAGYEPARLPFRAGAVTVENVAVELRGTNTRDVVVIGAHYDSVAGTVGANDNASGVAAALALARTFAGCRPARTLRFVFFANEEPPHFQTPSMGSVVYAHALRRRRERVHAMLSLETIGYYSDRPGSQTYPPPLDRVFPSVGNFIAFASNVASQPLLEQVVAAFRRATAFPSEAAALPAEIPGVGWSDQWAFWQQGYPGVMVTDTAPFRYPHYHTAADTPDKLDYDRMARVVEALAVVVAELAGATCSRRYSR